MRMNKWGFLTLILVVTLAVGALSAAQAEQTAAYQLGDKVEDFTVTLIDGQEVSLYGLLAEKKAVLLNFWASWCGPCQREFPYLQEAYDQLSDEVGMISLSVYDGDTNEAIAAFKEEHGLTTLPLGRAEGLQARFGVSPIPVSIIIDRNGILCMQHEGMVQSTRALTYALSLFTGDDYSEPVLLNDIPTVPLTEGVDSKVLSTALNAEGGELSFVSVQNDDGVWPFVPAEDGKSAVASNADVQSTTANLIAELNVKAGDVLTYEYRMTGESYEDRLVAFNNDEAQALHSGTTDWATGALRMEADGTTQITFVYARGNSTGYQAACELRNVRLLTGDEAAAYEFPVSDAPKTLEGAAVEIEPVTTVRGAVLVDADGVVTSTQDQLYITDADTVQLRLRIGADVDERFAGVSVIKNLMESKTTMLSDLEQDDQGYLISVNLRESLIGTMVNLQANVMGGESANDYRVFCYSEENAKAHMNAMFTAFSGQMTQEEFDAMEYFGLSCDGAPAFYTLDDLRAYMIAQGTFAAKEEAPAETAAPVYTITFADEQGAPIANVMAQICDEASCTVLPSDENGVVHFEGEYHAYEVHVLMAPAGYQVPQDSVALPENGGELTITLETVAP